MKVNSQYTGTRLSSYHTTISPRDTMNFAASIGDNNPLYFDDMRPQGIVAHPMHCVAATWSVLEKIQDYIELDDFPFDILTTQVHYTEQLILHRLILPGDQLEIKGRIAAILPHRAGTHMINCLEAFDQNGDPVFTEYIGALMRGVVCEDQGRGGETVPPDFFAEVDQLSAWESSIAIDPLLPFIYDGCSRIYFPIHTSTQFARQVGLPDIILQGTATLALAVKEIVNKEADSDPRRVKAISCRFTGMVVPGSTITLKVNQRNADGDVFFQVLNSEGRPAISRGHIKLN